MPAKMTLTEIQEHWEAAGRTLDERGTVTPTSRDPHLAAMERENILEFLPKTGDVLEVGCGDGVHTLAYAEAVERLYALDVAASLVERTRRRCEASRRTNVAPLAGSVLDLKSHFEPGRFAAVVSQRCLINLPDWETQQQALETIASMLRPGGLLVLTEGFDDGLDRLNEARRDLQLEEIRVVDYNCNFRREPFERFVRQRFDFTAVRDYGFYLFLSRVLHPLAAAPLPPRHDAPLNRAAAALAERFPFTEFSGFSYNLFYALRKNG